MNHRICRSSRFRKVALLAAPVLLVCLLSPSRAMAQVAGAGDEQLRFIDAMRGYLEIVDRFSQIAHDPGSSGIAAVVAAGEIFRGRSPEEAIVYFNKILGEVKNEAVQRAIRIQLVELYRGTGQNEKALDQLHYLMVSAPPEPRMPYAAPTGPGR